MKWRLFYKMSKNRGTDNFKPQLFLKDYPVLMSAPYVPLSQAHAQETILIRSLKSSLGNLSAPPHGGSTLFKSDKTTGYSSVRQLRPGHELSRMLEAELRFISLL